MCSPFLLYMVCQQRMSDFFFFKFANVVARILKKNVVLITLREEEKRKGIIDPKELLKGNPSN